MLGSLSIQHCYIWITSLWCCFVTHLYLKSILIDCAALILTKNKLLICHIICADPWYKFGLLERENDKEGNSEWQTLQPRTTGYQLSIPDLYYTIRTKRKIPGKTDLFLCADVTHYELYTTGRSRSGAITVNIHQLIMPVINQSIIKKEKKM